MEGDYDFDAPMFVDFDMNEQDSDVDKWFDNRDGHDGGFELDSLEEDNDQEPTVGSEQKQIEKVLETEKDVHADTKPIESKEPISSCDSTTSEEEESKIDKDAPFMFFTNKQPANIVTSWKTRSRSNAPASLLVEAKASEPPSKKAKPMPPSTSRDKSSAPRRSHRIGKKRRTSTSSSNDATRDVTKKPMPKTKPPMLTIPFTPNLMKRQKTKPNGPTDKVKEELELEAISKMQQDLKDKRKKNEDFMKKAFAASSYMPHRATEDNLTQAVEFHFETDKRIKNPTPNNCETKQKNFVETLRQHPISPSFKHRQPTKPQPFHLHENNRKRKTADEEENVCEGYVSMAQQCYSFQNATPTRFHTKHAKEQNVGPPPCQDNKNASKLTCPKTPNLSSLSRKRPLPDDCLSREQIEENVAEEMKNFKFKAKEFDPKIVEKQGTYGLKPLAPKTLTEIKPFNLASEQRSEIYKQKEKELRVEEKPAPFKAQPVPEFKKIEFRLDLTHQSTKQKPFSFDQRDKEIMTKKEEKIQSIFEEEKKAREFHAQPLQNFGPVELISNSKSLTKFESFNLETEKRGAVKADRWIQKVQDELTNERKKIVFKAHSSNVLYQAPFVPKKSLKPNTVHNEFNLNSERRAQDRAIYEMHKKEKELQDFEHEQQREAERQEEEARNIALLRKQLVHKSNPIRTYKQVEILASDKPLTQPQSPAWNTSKKMRI